LITHVFFFYENDKGQLSLRTLAPIKKFIRDVGSIKTFILLLADVPSEQSVFVMLNGEESELRFLNIANPKVRNHQIGLVIVAYNKRLFHSWERNQ